MKGEQLACLPADWLTPPRRVRELGGQASVAARVLNSYAGDRFLDVVMAGGEGVVIAGPKGTGKTTAALGLHAAVAERHGVACALVPLDVEATRVFAAAARRDTIGEVWKALAEVPLLVLDNAGCKLSIHAQEVWARVLGDRSDWLRPTVVLADRGRAQIEANAGAAVAARLLRVGPHIVVQ